MMKTSWYVFETIVSERLVREAQKHVQEAQEALHKAQEALRDARMNDDALHKSFHWVIRNGTPHQRAPWGALPIRESLRRRTI